MGAPLTGAPFMFAWSQRRGLSRRPLAVSRSVQGPIQLERLCMHGHRNTCWRRDVHGTRLQGATVDAL